MGLKKRVTGWVKTQRRKAKARAKVESEIRGLTEKAELEAYKKERVKQAKIRGRQRAKGGGGFLSVLGQYGTRAQKVQEEMFGFPSFGGKPRKKRKK